MKGEVSHDCGWTGCRCCFAGGVLDSLDLAFPGERQADKRRNRKVLEKSRIRKIDGGFGFIPHRFLTDGFWASLNPKEILLYCFLVLAGDRYGLSFYGADSICKLLKMTKEQYIGARQGLLENDLIAFDGRLFQVLALPQKPVAIKMSENPALLLSKKMFEKV